MRLGRNKGLALLNDRHLIEYVIENLSEICDEILISSNTGQCEKFGFQTVADEFYQKGPMAGIHACLKASSNEHNFVISVDTPFVTRPFIEFMLSERKGNLVAVPWYGKDHYEPLCGYYNKAAVGTMESFFKKGNYKLPDLFQALPFSPVKINNHFPGYHPMLFHNINTEEDLLLAEKYLDDANK